MRVMGPAEVAHGPMLIGFFFNVLLYGLSIAQTYIYFRNFKNDPRWMRSLVVGLFVADTVNTIFDQIYLYNSLILHFGDVAALGKADWVFATDPAMTGIIAMVVQTFFAWRVHVLTKNPFLVTLVLMCAFAGLLGSLATSIAVGIIPQFVNFQKFQVVVIIWLVAECVGDVAITGSLVWHLRSHKTGFKSSDNIVDSIIRHTVQTGAVTSAVALIDLILFLANPTGLHLIFNLPLSKLYTNSLMSSLNARSGWSFGGSNNDELSFSGTSMSKGHGTREIPARRVADVVSFTQSRAEVFVEVESHELRDNTLKSGMITSPISRSTSDQRTVVDDSDRYTPKIDESTMA